jgi:hypothetical protein
MMTLMPKSITNGFLGRYLGWLSMPGPNAASRISHSQIVVANADLAISKYTVTFWDMRTLYWTKTARIIPAANKLRKMDALERH